MIDTAAEQTLSELATRYWDFECYESPLTAALAGEPTADHVLFRESAADYERRYHKAQAFLQELRSLPPQALSAQSLATYRLLQHELTSLCRNFEVNAHLRPSLFPVGPEFNTIYFANSQTLGNLEAAQRYLGRLRTLPAFLQDIENNLRAGHALGIRYPRRVLECGVATQKASLAGPPQESAWYGPFKRAAAPHFAAIAAQGLTYIRDELYPALNRYGSFLSGPLSQDARDTISCADSPQGADYYSALIRQFTNLDMTADDIHELGLREVQRLDAEIAAVAHEAGYPDDVPGYRKFLAADPSFFAADAAALRERLEVLAKRIDRRIPTLFGRLPRTSYGVESIPLPLSEGLPPAYAQPNPADHSAAGVLWITSLPAKCPSYMHVPLALHEGWPGHLMHIGLIQEMQGLPKFRRFGAVKYTACVEGWALYCETLGLEMQLYVTPHQHYGRLEFEMWRAVRLVLDTAIHAKGWSRERSIDYMAAHLALPRATIESEVDRYIALPGQALAYQLGNLRIRELRRRAELACGEKFSLRDFHDAVTGIGAVTLPVLDELMGGWIAMAARP
ncbi:MAG: DUF885 domain-containing protein [Proteobacteria bacterium]|nr:DUF885 domain-containing protein [Pseudomonadota bacterium]